MKRLLPAALVLALFPAAAQDVSLEYRVKAGYLYNFVKFIEWPPAARAGPITMCVAGRNPFGTVLDDTIRDEVVRGRQLTARVSLEPDAGCHVLFIPDGASAAYLRAARGTSTLTVGETSDFLTRGGIVNFVTDGRYVRFEISTEAAERAQLQVSSRLLQLAINTRGSR